MNSFFPRLFPGAQHFIFPSSYVWFMSNWILLINSFCSSFTFNIEITWCYSWYLISANSSNGNDVLSKNLSCIHNIRLGTPALTVPALVPTMLNVYKFKCVQVQVRNLKLTVMACFKSNSWSLSSHFICDRYGLAPNTRHCSCSVWPSCVLPPPIIGKFGSDVELTSRIDISSGDTNLKIRYLYR